jgi:hypothetical protein
MVKKVYLEIKSSRIAILFNGRPISTIALRKYGNEREKWQYGWSRTIPYICHTHKNNFNYQSKLQDTDNPNLKRSLISYLHLIHIYVIMIDYLNVAVSFHYLNLMMEIQKLNLTRMVLKCMIIQIGVIVKH